MASGRNFPTFATPHEITGPWTVQFDPKWGGPESAVFDQLVSWTQRPEEGIKYFSGTATYRKTFDLPETLRRPGQRLTLDLGDVKNLAEVRLNGKKLGILWAMPFRVDVTDAIKPAGNDLEIEVVNFWPNRIIGDQFLAPEKRFTRTNIRKLTKDTPLLDSGLLGPVRVLAEER
jgi:beta-galactosidase/beta-glucuronidase